MTSDWTAQTKRELATATPELCVTRLAQLVAMRERLDDCEYWELMVALSGVLYLRTLKEVGAI